MSLPPWMQVNLLELVMLAAHWLSLWLGLYLIGRRPRSAAGVLLGCAFVALCTYFLSAAFLAAPEPVPGDDLWGVWLGGWVSLAPAFMVHGFLVLTGARLPHQKTILTIAYAAAVLLCVLSFSPTIVYRYTAAPPGATTDVNGTLTAGPLYPLFMVQLAVTLALALLVLRRARLARPLASARVRTSLNALLTGTALTVVATAGMFAAALLNKSLAPEAVFYPLLGVGALVIGATVSRYPGLFEGQLMRSDLWASLLGATALLSAFTALVLAGGASFRVLAGLGWLVLALFVLADEIRAQLDRAFYGAGSRAGRAGLRAVAAFAGSDRALDLNSLSAGQAEGVADYMSDLDRAGIAAAQLERGDDPRLELLALEEFDPVRSALGLAPRWTPEAGLDFAKTYGHATAGLEPRERQALGLKYLGYSDKEMARLMGVKVGVPRSYLGEGKRKLGFAAGAQLMLFVHFSDLVGRDALPLLTLADPAAAENTPVRGVGET